MSEATDKILEWAGEVGEYRAIEWERLPEIYLYMDQVLTYMDGNLRLFGGDEGGSPLTSSMINNYVKAGVLPRPEQKKYSREHLALLTVICMLKQVLSIGDVSTMLKALLKDAQGSEMYERFCGAQESALQEVCGRVKEQAPKGEAELLRLAIELSVEANARRTAAERILSVVTAAENARESAAQTKPEKPAKPVKAKKTKTEEA